jgi:two-component sensor histidine kinase
MAFDIDTAIPLGLILNEFITNAFKYAFKDKGNNSITVTINKTNDNNYILAFKDNGVGLPGDIDIKKTKSLGLRLISRLAKQLHGEMNYMMEDGAVFTVTFKDAVQRQTSD